MSAKRQSKPSKDAPQEHEAIPETPTPAPQVRGSFTEEMHIIKELVAMGARDVHIMRAGNCIDVTFHESQSASEQSTASLPEPALDYDIEDEPQPVSAVDDNTGEHAPVGTARPMAQMDLTLSQVRAQPTSASVRAAAYDTYTRHKMPNANR